MANANDRDITQMTADVIKANGLETATHIRAYAKRAKEECEQMTAYAEKVANAVIEASEQAAQRIAGYMKRCEDARASLQKHMELLTELPPAEPIKDEGTRFGPGQPPRPQPRIPSFEREIEDAIMKDPPR